MTVTDVGPRQLGVGGSELNRLKGRASAWKIKVPPSVVQSEVPKQGGRDAHTWQHF